MKLKAILFALPLFCNVAFAQDSSNTWVHSHKTAAIWSLCLPGAGQVYNEIGYRKLSNKKHRAWWKVPIIYAGLGACGYYLYSNFQSAQHIKEEILYRREYPNLFLHPDLLIYSNETQLRSQYDFFAGRRDLMLFATIGVWGINVLEATVDAHFVAFDVSENLGMKVIPTMYDPYSAGIKLGFYFN